MSSKPATPGAAGAPRLLLYVAEQRQPDGAAGPPPPPPAAPPPPAPPLYLDSSHHLHRHTLYTNGDQVEHLPNNTLYYKPITEEKFNVFGADNIHPRPELYPVQRTYYKDCIKIDDGKLNTDLVEQNVKQDNLPNVEYTNLETFQNRLPLENSEIYQNQCPPYGTDCVASMQPIVICQNQYSENAQSVSETNSDKEACVNKSYVNYQLLEQSVTHQSIVNQSISILNQQVGVSRSVNSEVEGGAQLVRTADGVVLAVVPQAQPGQQLVQGPDNRTVVSEASSVVTVPLGWKRITSGASVIYVSPSGTALSSQLQLREYLQTAGTCKCGLPCPLRPEVTFSFDSKVASKPYQPPTGGELTRLCNHKRKLLATLSARSQSPATPPPPPLEQKKGAGEFAILKKKMRKRSGFSTSMAVPQLVVQRERPSNEFKTQDMGPCRTSSPGLSQRTKVQPPCLPYPGLQQNMANVQEGDGKLDTPVQRGSHYLTVNSGWIQQETIDPNNPTTSNNSLNVGVPILGNNGQIIGVNTSFNKNYKDSTNSIPVSQQPHVEEKDDKKDLNNVNKPKEDEPQIFCGLNQPLTPEVMQKINEQQHRFIQQNQKQIDLAMKGYRTQLENTNKNNCQNQFVPQGQLLIQNGAVVKTNPAKTPPWQVKRNDSNSIASPSPKSQKSDNMEFEESNTNFSEESTSSNNSFQGTESMNQGMCSRVPPLPQHYNMMGQQWPAVDANKKKPKPSKSSKKKPSQIESKVPFGANGLRLHDIKGKSCDEISSKNVPSFMDDPNGYLAQQTVLLNNTISRQVGMNSNFDNNTFDGSNCFTPQIQGDKTKIQNKPGEMQNVYRNNMVPNSLQSPNNAPDSSVVSDKTLDNSISNCCKGCNVNPKNGSELYVDNQYRRTYMKHGMFNKVDMDNTLTSPKHSFEDNPVTSSTFVDRGHLSNETCGPIQAGTVSTSNVSPVETLMPPEPSPTPSNSSRNTDTPHSNGSSGSLIQNCSYPIPSPAYSNPGSSRDNFNSNPPTPGPSNPYSSPGPQPNNSLTGTQMMHFISNHNVNKNLMEVDNISMVGVKPGLKPDAYRIDSKKRIENSMPGYCPPPHLGGGPAHSLIQACYVQTFITTMASGFSVTRDTMTSVLAGKANTATTSINASHANFVRPPPPPSVNMATSYAIPNNHPDPFIHSVNLPTSYPLHIAGTTAQNMISKSPLEMVQNMISGSPSKSESNTNRTSPSPTVVRRSSANPGQILISSTGQIIVSNSPMPPPPPKTTTAHSPNQLATNVSTSVTQVIPGIGQPVLNQQTVVVNTLPAPFMIQPSMMVDGQVVQNSVLPQIVGGQIDGKTAGCVQGVAMLSPESMKKKNKKKKSHANVTNVLQISAPQQNNNIVVHSSPQHNTSPQFSPRGFQLSPNNNISPPMLQALTIVPGKSGTPAHIVMNGQGNTNNFGSQQIITNTSPSQQINLLQPVNLINNASGVVSNFPAFQQFIVPNLGGMVMTADGTAIIQENAPGVPMQLQLQTVNGQNVLTHMQNPGVFAAGTNGGVVLRTQNQQGKIIQSQHSPGAQFLSPNNQVMMNSPNFNGQLSPLLANLSPTNVTFNTSPHQVRTGNVQTQEFIQTNQMGQTLMVPLSPKSIASATTNRSNSTFVQQNTTIVQQQTTLVSNSHNNHVSTIPASMQGGNASRLSIDPNVLIKSAHKQITSQMKGRNNMLDLPTEEENKGDKGVVLNQGGVSQLDGAEYTKLASVRQSSVSTQTLKAAAAAAAAASAPDTTTHSPPAAAAAASPRRYSSHHSYADTTTESPEPADAHSSAMVQCVSSSEQDMAETQRAEPDENGLMSNIQLMRQTRTTHNSVESTEMQYNHHTMSSQMHHHQNMVPMPQQHFYDRSQSYKRKNEFETPSYRNEKIMRTSYNMTHVPKEGDYDVNQDKSPRRHYTNSGHSSDTNIQRLYDRHNLGAGHDTKLANTEGRVEDIQQQVSTEKGVRKFEAGDLVWGPVKGYASWPGKLESRATDGRWRVRWFGGDRARGLADHARLLTLSEGLEAHHAARTKHRKSRKLNTHLENAIQEAMAELDKKSEVGGDDTPSEPAVEEPSCSSADTPRRRKSGKDRRRQGKLPKLASPAKLRSAR